MFPANMDFSPEIVFTLVSVIKTQTVLYPGISYSLPHNTYTVSFFPSFCLHSLTYRC